MKLKINPDFIFSKEKNVLKVTSVLPDQNEIFHFSGDVVQILELSFGKHEVDRTFIQAQIDKKINDQDWNQLIQFLLDKNIVLK